MIWKNFSILEQISPSPSAHARTCCEDFCGCRAGEMAYFIKFELRFRFCWLSYQNSFSVFYIRSVKFHHVKETHDINSLLTLVKIAGSSIPAQKNNQTNLCQDLLTLIENTNSDLKVHALHYANELLVLAFQKLLQTRQTSRNNKKLCKKGFWL